MNTFTNMKVYGMAVVAMLSVPAMMSAQDTSSLPLLDGAVMELNKEYLVPEGMYLQEVSAEFTAPKDMRLAINYKAYSSSGFTFLTPYMDEEFEEEYSPEVYKQNSGDNIALLVVKSGDKVYLHNDFLMSDNFSVMLSDADEALPEIRFIEPGTETVLSASANKFIDVVLTDAVTVGSVTISVNDSQYKTYATMVTEKIARVDLQNVMMGWYREGILHEGDELTVLFSDVVSASKPENKVNGSGEIKLVYKVKGRPVSIVSVDGLPVAGEKEFWSYYLPGNPLATAKIVFDGPLMDYDKMKEGRENVTKYPFILQIGKIEDLNAYFEEVVPEYDADTYTVSFDFSGKLRTYAEMDLTNHVGEEFEYMNFLVQNIKGADGQYVNTPGDGTIGSIGYQYKYVELSNKGIASDFVVFDQEDNEVYNKVLKPGYRMEVYVMSYKDIVLDGFAFEYETAQGTAFEIVPMTEIELKEEPGFETDINYVFTVPELTGALLNGAVKVYPSNLLSNDGLDHLNSLTGNFKWGQETTGIAGIESEGGVVDVYGVDGALVLRGATANQIKNLSKGMYIAGGKKVLVK